ncbi:MAG: hypothetical protein WCG80_03475 [Spirochaetales bacterium]
MTWQLLAFFGAKLLAGLFVLLLVVGFFRRMGSQFGHGHFGRRRAVNLAGSRYAKGEITADEYRQIRDDLKETL